VLSALLVNDTICVAFTPLVLDLARARRHDPVPYLLALATGSNIGSSAISNVPAVMLFTPVVPHVPDPPRAWLALAMSSTLAGNLTIIGSIANLIVVESARRRGVTVSASRYAKAGIPITIATIAFGVWWLSRSGGSGRSGASDGSGGVAGLAALARRTGLLRVASQASRAGLVGLANLPGRSILARPGRTIRPT
jgi:Na+/H+ antiporter NhaD/arsenite permease-like protein